MEINRATLDKIAHLARLEFSDSEAEKMIKDMTEIVTWVEKLKEVDTTGIAPLTAMSHETNALRPDTTAEHLTHDRALSQSPHHDSDYFLVPKVID